MPENSITVSSQSYKPLVKILIAIAFILVFIKFLPLISDILIMLIVSILFYSVISPIVDRLEFIGMSRTIASLIVVLLLVGIFAIALRYFVPLIIREALSLNKTLQSKEISNLFIQFQEWLNHRLPGQNFTANLTTKLGELFDNLFSKLANFILGLSSVVTAIVIIPFIVFLLTKDSRKIKKALIGIVPNKYFEITLILWSKIELQLSSYIRGQILAALGVGIMSTIGLILLNWLLNAHITYYLFIGMLAGIANLIPFIGPFVGMIPAILIAIMNNPETWVNVTLWIILMFVIVQMIDNTLISPTVVGRSVDMHPLVILIVLLIGGNLMGPIGMLFAVPAAGIIKVVFEEVVYGLRDYRILV
jgi:predicted PurR-regulated permease PerM